jgi:glycosyltransferase involved in cell wall biosynthesis
MKVLVVSNMYPTAANPIGGIFVHEQVKALRRIGIDARVVSGKPRWLSARNPRAFISVLRDEWRVRKRGFVWRDYEGVPMLAFNYFAGALARPWLYPLIYRNGLMSLLDQMVRDFPYDLVHTHTALLDGRAGVAAGKFRAVPMVLTEHTGPFALAARDWRLRRHTLAAMQSADRLIAVSHALRREIAFWLPQIEEDRISIVPNGVDTRFFDPGIEVDGLTKIDEGPSAGPEDKNQAKTLLWVGHLVAVKRVDRLLAAFAIAARRRPGLKLRIIGGGELEAELKRQADALRISQAVTFRPAAGRDVIRQEMRGADFLVISSDTETFGVVGIEAMAMGLPVLTTNCGGPSDYVVNGQNGECVGNSPEELAIGIQRMVDGSIALDKSAIRRHIVQHFDFEVVAKGIGDIYRALTGPDKA